MSKALSAIVVIIIIVVIAGSVAYFFLYGGFSDEDKKKKDIIDNKNISPTAYFTANDTARVGDLIIFDANGSFDEDGYITNYVWNFNDGSPQEQLNISEANHTFYQPGVYEINLTVYDNDNAKDTFIDEITVIPVNYVVERQAVLLKRFEIDTENETIPIEEFAESLLIDITVTGASFSGGPIPTNAVVELTLTNSVGIQIANETIETIGQNNTEFYFSKNDLIYLGDYEFEAICLQGALYLDYRIEVNYE